MVRIPSGEILLRDDRIKRTWEVKKRCIGSYCIFCGGGWADDERGCLATNRRRSHPASFKIDDLGLRLARIPPSYFEH